MTDTKLANWLDTVHHEYCDIQVKSFFAVTEHFFILDVNIGNCMGKQQWEKWQ